MELEFTQQWAVVSLFGHKTYLGMLTTSKIGTEALMRISVPLPGQDLKPMTAVDECKPRVIQTSTVYFGIKSVYSISPITEETAFALYRNNTYDNPIDLFDINKVLNDRLNMMEEAGVIIRKQPEKRINAEFDFSEDAEDNHTW